MTERLHTNRAAEDRRPRRTLRTTSPCSHRSATGSLCSVHQSGSPRGEGPGAPLSVTPKIDTFIDENMRGDFEYIMEMNEFLKRDSE